jgi:hypothetical protein
MEVRGLPIAGDAASIHLAPEVNADGSARLVRDHDGSGWLGVVYLAAYGPRGAGMAGLTLTASQARDLAAKLTRQADFAEARSKREPAPCLCTAWQHNLYPCSNVAAEDFSMCRECWTPETGQSLLDMGHGKPVSA